jgi:hypothetical protein
MTDIVSCTPRTSDLGGGETENLTQSFMVGGCLCVQRPGKPSYPNWQRKRIQNPSSVSSNLTEGTT